MQKAYNRINWENYPEMNTPLSEANLNRMDAAINEVDNRVISLDTTKATKVEVSELFSDISFDESSGVLTFTRKNGGTVKIDTKLEKLAVNFAYDAANERLLITLADGTVQPVDMKALITQYEFTESDTIILSVDSAGKVSATIKKGSITGEMLEPNYLANVTVQAESASASASAAASSAANAAMSEENAQKSEANAEISAGIADRAASAANESASAASGAASAAEHYADETQTNAGAAIESASTATSKAEAAVNAASAAAASASTANSKASAAATSATNAAASAETAAEEADRAEAAAERAESVAAVSVATTSKAGIVKPDGSTIKVASDGTITGFDGNYNSLSNRPSIPAAVAVKGNAEGSYRTGNVNLTASNIGASELGHKHSASDITSGILPVIRGGTGCSTGAQLAEMIVAYSGGAGVETGTFDLKYNGTSALTCNYCKVGKIVYAYAMAPPKVSVPANSMLTGLPFTIKNNFAVLGAIAQSNGNITVVSTAFTNLSFANGTQIQTKLALDPAGPCNLALIYVTD